ncbi:hypothetical protein [uncultured Hymenobacter sp.]|uniref:hypothetical protein n=1 Tax=uncultured Hymenobacter sp. TaxID=170016 RepID=UPI0035CC2181
MTLLHVRDMNVYQMYRHNDLRYGFWIVRDSWGNTLARITEIEGVSEGSKIKGRYPYYGNPKVWADFYDLRTLQLVNQRCEVSCPGTYAYQMVRLSRELALALGFTPEEAGCLQEPVPSVAAPDEQPIHYLLPSCFTEWS